jgi:hypothetical protein
MAGHFSEISRHPQVYLLPPQHRQPLAPGKIPLFYKVLWPASGLFHGKCINREFISAVRRQFSEILLPSAGTMPQEEVCCTCSTDEHQHY